MAFAADQVRYVAALAMLQLTEEEVARFAAQVDQILAYVDTLRELATDEVPPTSHAIPMANVFRPDVVAPSLPVEQVLANAPQREGPWITVPRVLEEM